MTTAIQTQISMVNSLMTEIVDKINLASNNGCNSILVEIPHEYEKIIVGSFRDKGYCVDWVNDFRFTHKISWELTGELSSELENYFLS